MSRQIVTTADGSHTVHLHGSNVMYHSHHGAIQESLHVFISAGLHHIAMSDNSHPIRIFEVGFGTGLNVLLTYIEAVKASQPIHYTAVENDPLSPQEYEALNYEQFLSCTPGILREIHAAPWNLAHKLSDFFTLRKLQIDLQDFSADDPFHLIYYDAFAPAAQPELWTEQVFGQLFHMLLPGAALVTYCSKSDVQRAMKSAGFKVQKLTGPKGKREMIRGIRSVD